ncbi:hypothetical protein A2U01_0064206, partial [Trifolium medium]|nr:hypothetical protein [Trifolium medium]
TPIISDSDVYVALGIPPYPKSLSIYHLNSHGSCFLPVPSLTSPPTKFTASIFLYLSVPPGSAVLLMDGSSF